MTSRKTLDSVLVVGGCGFLGHHIVSQIKDSEPATRLAVLDLRTERNRFPSVSYHDGDISSRTEVKSILEQIRPSVIIHTASPHAANVHDEALFEEVNIRGTRNLVACALELGTVKAFVYTSSASVVHDNVSDLVNADETLPVLRVPQQTEYYSHTKGVAEEIVLAANQNNRHMMTAALRPAGIFGEGDLVTVASMVKAAESGKYKFQLGNGQNLFDFTYVANLVDAHLLAAKALLEAHDSAEPLPKHLRVDGEAFFITNDDPYPFWDFARAIGAAAGYAVRKEDIWVIPKSAGLLLGTISEWVVWFASLGRDKAILSRKSIRFSCMTRTYCIDKAKRRLGYKPRVSMQEGIRRSGAWMMRDREKVE